MKNEKILRNTLISVGVLLAFTPLLTAGTSDALGKRPLVPPQPTIITFDPPGSTFTLPSAITATGVIIGSYWDANYVTEHGFIRTPAGTFTTFAAQNFNSGCFSTGPNAGTVK